VVRGLVGGASSASDEAPRRRLRAESRPQHASEGSEHQKGPTHQHAIYLRHAEIYRQQILQLERRVPITRRRRQCLERFTLDEIRTMAAAIWPNSF
jgi:hypothetical protein